MACLTYSGGWLLTADRPDDPHYLYPGASIVTTDISRDGRLVCFGKHGSRVLVFDARTGKLVWQDARCNGDFDASFTPDGRWLVSSHHAFRVGDWETNVLLDPSRTGRLLDVSPDSRLALMSASEGHARLVEIESGRELVRIEAPDRSLGQMAFTPDGVHLVEPCTPGVRIWDLRRIRRRLAEYGLDWEGPAYPPEPDRPAPPPPLQLTVVGGELLSDPAKLRDYERD